MKIAGNDVLVPFARSDRFIEELEQICLPDKKDRLGPEAYRERPAVMLNALLSRAAVSAAQGPDNHPVARAIAGGLPRGEQPWLGLRSLIYLYASGLAFYLGLHARQWLEGLTVKEVHVVFSGRGSSLLSWLTQGERVEQLLATAFQEGATVGGEPREVRIEFYVPHGGGVTGRGSRRRRLRDCSLRSWRERRGWPRSGTGGRAQLERRCRSARGLESRDHCERSPASGAACQPRQRLRRSPGGGRAAAARRRVRGRWAGPESSAIDFSGTTGEPTAQRS